MGFTPDLPKQSIMLLLPCQINNRHAGIGIHSDTMGKYCVDIIKAIKPNSIVGITRNTSDYEK